MSPGNYEDLDKNLFFRTFYRGTDPKTNEADPTALPDVDSIADEKYQEEYFVDNFGLSLRNDLNFRALNTYNELCTHFWDDPDIIVQTYCLADNQGIAKQDQKDWFRSELRFITLIVPVDESHPKTSASPILSVTWAPWFYLIASSASINSEQDILHVMSWTSASGQFHYYARDEIQGIPSIDKKRAWIYLCDSEDAFDAQGKSYLGPLNGHVNGGLVMKEIHKPWLHWLVGGRNVTELLTDELTKELTEAKWLTGSGSPPLYGASVVSAESFERVVLDSLREWFSRRQQRDFLHEDGSAKKTPSNVQRWAAHFLLTTNINIIAVPTSNMAIPSDFFFNYETLRGYGDLLPNSVQQTSQWQATHPYSGTWLSDFTTKYGKAFRLSFDDSDPQAWYDFYDLPAFAFDHGSYLWAARKLKLCNLQEVPHGTPDAITFRRDTLAGGVFMGTLQDGREDIDGGDDTCFGVLRWGEGDFPWVILQSSVEDAMGVFMSQKMFVGTQSPRSRCRLFSDAVFNAISMVDFWNPVFSWRRLRLMQYMPVDTELVGPEYDPITGEQVFTYDLEARFIANIKNAIDQWGSDDGCPEREFLNNLGPDGKGLPVIAFQIRIWLYTTQVSNNLGSADYIEEYLRLAESRRRLFRPLPQNFFGSNLPYCLAIPPDAKFLEMTERGTVQEIPDQGVQYLVKWLGGLAGSNPTVIPTEEVRAQRVEAGHPPLPTTGLPRSATMRMACQKSIFTTNGRRGGSCPFMKRSKPGSSNDMPNTTTADAGPTWEGAVKDLFAEPWWPLNKEIGAYWIKSMSGPSGMRLDDFETVKKNVIVIYQHLRSRSMPLAASEDEYWPEEALEILRHWANTGCREKSTDLVIQKVVIAAPSDPLPRIRVRRDIMSMTKKEIDHYRMKLDDVLHCMEDQEDSKWQEMGWLHAQWCLHYQEATMPWHRAMLTYFENVIDCAIPYWNGYAVEAADPASPFAGIPQAFLDEEYYHPVRKEMRKNPLRYALNAKQPRTPPKRDEILVRGRPTNGDDSEWNDKIKTYIGLYQKQVKDSLQAATFSFPEGMGFPWQDLPKFTQDEPDSNYKYRTTFDGLFEQPHDNFHGWLGGIGGDMSDNTWTGFDPLFYSMHGNLDRLFDMWLRTHPDATFSSNFPLRPFSAMATAVRYDDPRQYICTTIGDMVKDTRSLGYVYGPPASPDYSAYDPRAARMASPTSQGGSGLISPSVGLQDSQSSFGANKRDSAMSQTNGIIDAATAKVPYVVFSDVRCTTETYRIDVYLVSPAGDGAERTLIAQSTRLGMGPVTPTPTKCVDKRCQKPAVTRAINVSEFADKVKKAGNDLEVRVLCLTSGKEIAEAEHKTWNGFQPTIIFT